MEKINAVITGVGGYVPDYILTNEEISKMVIGSASNRKYKKQNQYSKPKK
jgi:3-oxoacyl-[acyl-carrier-protein] synthase III